MNIYIAKEQDSTYATKKNIQDFAEDLAKKLDFTPGKDITELLGILDIKIEYENPLLEIGDRIDGSMIINKKRKSIKIKLSNLSSTLRNNFTIAHELGHLFLHSKKIDSNKISFTRYGSNRLEWEANWFAGSFLMPKQIFQEKLKEFNENTFELAHYFNVSESAIKVRKKSL